MSRKVDHNKHNHGFYRSQVCLICFKKTDFMKIVYVINKEGQKVPGAILKRVREEYFENFNPEDSKLPNGICGRCNNLLNRNPSALLDPIDFSSLRFPVLTRSIGENVSNLDDLLNCTCDICKVGRENAGSPGHKYGGKRKQGNYPRGRPPTPSPTRLPAAKPITICSRCRQLLQRGKPHPCTITSRREEMESQMQLDQKGLEMAFAKLAKEKAAAAPEGSNTISFATQGTPLTLPKPGLPKPRIKAQFSGDQQITADEFEKLQAAGNFGDNDMKLIAEAIR